jgi:hypothetical protein
VIISRIVIPERVYEARVEGDSWPQAASDFVMLFDLSPFP